MRDLTHAWFQDLDDEKDDRRTPSPGKVTLTSRLAPHRDGLRVDRAIESRVDDRPPRTGATEPGADPFAVHLLDRAAASSGEQVPGTMRGRLEEALGAELGGVRMHTGAASANAAAALGANAYAVGQDVHFGAGRYDPSSLAGQHLIAHEVAHTVQQRGATPAVQGSLEVSSPGDAHEVEADAFADAFVAGGARTVRPVGHGGIARAKIQRDAAPGAGGLHGGQPATDAEPVGGASKGPDASTGGKITLGEVKWKRQVPVGSVTLDLDIKLAGDMRLHGSVAGGDKPAPGNGTEVKVGGVANASKPNAGLEAEVKKKFQIAALGLKPEIKLGNEVNFLGKGEVKLGELSFSPHEASFFGGAVKWKPLVPAFKILKWEPGKAPELGKFALKTDVTFDGSHLLKNAKPGEKAEVHVTLEGSAALAVWQTLWKQLLERYGASVAARALLPSGAVAALVGGLMMIAAANNHGKDLQTLADATSGECRSYCLSFVRAVMNQGAAVAGVGGAKGFAAGQAKRAELIAQHGSAEMVDMVLRDKYKSPPDLYNEVFNAQYDDYWIAAVKEYRKNHWFSATFHGDDLKFGDYMNARSTGKGYGRGGDGG